MTRFIILRHGLSEYNKARRFQGHLDIPLHAIGLEQAEASAKYVLEHYKVDRVYSSDLSRAAQTARPIADALGLPLELDARLREIDMGLWQGLGFEEAIARFPETERIRKECLGKLRYDGGESYGDVMARARACADEIAAQNEGKTVVLASHGGTIRALFSSWL
ncbi:MAG: histidine phosphatase family protein, partial [Clostridia bacterium]|nr:histidine phosphatase family protein [Clostridia bacterium]